MLMFSAGKAMDRTGGSLDKQWPRTMVLSSPTTLCPEQRTRLQALLYIIEFDQSGYGDNW